MAQTALVMMAADDYPEGRGRMTTLLTTALELGDEVDVYFHGAGVNWLATFDAGRTSIRSGVRAPIRRAETKNRRHVQLLHERSLQRRRFRGPIGDTCARRRRRAPLTGRYDPVRRHRDHVLKETKMAVEVLVEYTVVDGLEADADGVRAAFLDAVETWEPERFTYRVMRRGPDGNAVGSIWPGSTPRRHSSGCSKPTSSRHSTPAWRGSVAVRSQRRL